MVISLHIVFSCCNIPSYAEVGFWFDIHMPVHRKYNSKLQPTRCNIFWFIYFYRRCTCFRRLCCPSSGAHNCTYSFRYRQPILLFAAIVDEMEMELRSSSISSTIAASSSIGWWSCMYSYVLLMMGRGTAWNM